MSENLYYLFVSGMILSSGPCLASCAPFLAAYTAGRRSGVRDSFLSYFVFSFFKILAYLVLAGICALGSSLIRVEQLLPYRSWIYGALGILIMGIGIAMLVDRKENNAFCACLCRQHATNIALFGFLIGLAPCLPLVGILNYVMVISKTPMDAFLYVFVFGLGTVLSPLMIVMVVSAKVSSMLARFAMLKSLLRVFCAIVLIFLGLITVTRVIG
ncbi:MAG TPA: sulfite exporter TauE/SafE family protein [Candidatus Omnitrophota bacterium]|nr:sulfite exporter TauE/SafE family protein [Candidatus Omnitrophota bacterium]HQL40947.1 sulfite exporter TauE/SafE family protein [Candidatus Omnitrophota bacterium]